MDNKEGIDTILECIRMETAEIYRKYIVMTYELGKSAGAIEALEAVDKKIKDVDK